MSEVGPGQGGWRILSVRRLVDDRWLRLDAERVQTAAGAIIDPWYIAHGNHWACTVAATPAGQVILVEQYRRGVDRRVLELPAGNIEPGEQPAAAACRELAEETGFLASAAPEAIGAWWPEPAHNSACAHGFLVAVHAQPVTSRPDPEEHLQVHLLSPTQVDQAIRDGRFCHAAQIAFWCQARDRVVATSRA